MIVVVESGATKADWMILSEKKKLVAETRGLNPNFHSQQDIIDELAINEVLSAIKDKVFEVHFYGAGCASIDSKAIIQEGLSSFFKQAKVSVESDLTASAYACFEGRPEIACILGTGSNSCYFDGLKLREETPSIGYILGDEGSGCYFGKQLLTDFLYKRLPKPMHRTFLEMGLSKSKIVELIYKNSGANVFIASLTPVLLSNRDLPYAQALIRKGFQEFIDVHVKCYEGFDKVEVNFVGSIAALFERELKAVCLDNGIKVGRIVRRPLGRLVEYHMGG